MAGAAAGGRQRDAGLIPVLGLVVVQLAVAALLWGALPQRAPFIRPFPWPVLAGLFALSEAFVIHLHLRRESQGISLSEISLVLGLLFAAPLELAVARLVGELPVFLRRQTPLKAVFNLTQHAAAVGLAGTVYAAGGYEALATTGAIALRSGGLDLRTSALAIASGPAQATGMGTLGVIAAYALAADARSAWLLAVAVGVVFLAYRAHARLTDRHRSLERLYHFSQVVSASPNVDAVLHSALVQAREMLRTEHAEVVFPARRGADTFVRVLLGRDGRLEWVPAEQGPPPGLAADRGGGRALLLPRGHRDRFLERHGLREAVAVPLPGEGGAVGVPLVAHAGAGVRAFDEADVRLLETVANHASVALENGRLIEALRRDALHDGLTGLPNRVLLQRRVQEAVAAVDDGDSRGCALMMMDLDGFKDVNDTLGHQNGDLLLVEVAERLRGVLRPGALAARLGGDEFALLVPGASDPASAPAAAADVLAALKEPVAVEDTVVEVGASLGVALAPVHGTDVPTLLKRADLAMYAAKSTGVGVQVYEKRFEPSRPVRLALVGELRQGLAGDQLVVAVQPKAMTVTGVGAGPLGTSKPRAGRAGPLRAARRALRVDPPADQLRAAHRPPRLLVVAAAGRADRCRGQPVRAGAHPGLRRRGRPAARAHSGAALPAHPRDHREQRDERPDPRHRGALAAARHRRAAVSRRLRHGVLVAVLPQGPARARGEDRPVVRRDDARP